MGSSYTELKAENSALKVENAALRDENASLRAENTVLKKEVSTLQELVKGLLKRISSLEAKLNQNSTNSSKPPSSDQKPNLPREPRAEQRPFHPGVGRQLLPESKVTSFENRKVEVCPRCHADMIPTGEVVKWQQIELPEITPLVHQWNLHVCRCSKCGTEVTPTLEEGEQFLLGSRLEAFVCLCLSRFRQGHRTIREFVTTLLPGVDLSQGLISKIKARAARALKAPHQQIIENILKGEFPIHIDATGWRHQSRNEHAVVMRAGKWVGFSLIPCQNTASIAALLVGKNLKVVSDRGLPLSGVRLKTHQYCLAHLLRNVRGWAEHPSTSLEEANSLGEMYDTLQSLFIDRHRMSRGEISVSTWRTYGYLSWSDLVAMCEEILASEPSEKVRRGVKRLLSNCRHFMVYLRARDSPMTNNPAEEALRSLVIARKLCFGSRSEYGREWRQAIQSCVETFHRQGLAILDFLAAAIHADRLGQPCPSIG